MAGWWTAASWRLQLVVVVGKLFMLMVGVPLHCAAAQLVARTCWLLQSALRRALADVQVLHRRLLVVVITFLFVACCRGGLRRGEPLAVALLHGSLVLLVTYMGVSVVVVASPAERLHVNEHG